MGYSYMTLKGKLDILAGSDDSILYFIQTRSSVNFLCPSVMGRRIIEMTTLAKMDSHRHLAIDAIGKNLTAPVEAAVTAAVVERHSDTGELPSSGRIIVPTQSSKCPRV